jgi:hypothetical protein
MLLESGALIDVADKEGCTALHIAAAHGHELLIGVLLAMGADPKRKGKSGMSPMHFAAMCAYVECCRKFLQAQVELDARDDSGRSVSLFLNCYRIFYFTRFTFAFNFLALAYTFVPSKAMLNAWICLLAVVLTSAWLTLSVEYLFIMQQVKLISKNLLIFTATKIPTNNC